MTNDAAGKLNFREPVKITGINYFVDVDDHMNMIKKMESLLEQDTQLPFLL